jgi:hypothetical protein
MRTFEEGREAQFGDMMQQLAVLQAKYKGVRGELLAKVSEEFERLRPGHQPQAANPVDSKPRRPVAVASPPPLAETPKQPAPVAMTPHTKSQAPRAISTIQNALPSCRVCGRGMKPKNGLAGDLVCERGHVRAA